MISPTELQEFIDRTYREAQLPANTRKVILPKKYGTTFPPIALATTATQQIQIASNGDFFLTRISFRGNIAAAAQTVNSVPVPNMRCLITDSGSDEQWANQAIDLSQWGQNAGLGFYMDEVFPRVIGGKSTITIALTNFDAALSTVGIDFTLHGVICKVFG